MRGRLETARWIQGHKEDIDFMAERRPARRYYTLAGAAAAEVCMALAQFSAEVSPPDTSPTWGRATRQPGLG